MLLDANVLLYAADEDSPRHVAASAWLEAQLNGDRRVGIPWESLTAFVRVITHPRIVVRPLTPESAWSYVEDWLLVPVVWVPLPTDQHASVLGHLVAKYRPTGNLVPDAHLAALAIEHGAEVISTDTDFARFTEIRWRNPLAGS